MELNHNKINILNYWIDIESSSPPTIKTSNFTNKGDVKWNQVISFNRKDDILWSEPLISNIEEPDSWVHKVFLGVFNTKYVIEEFSTNDLSDIKYTHNTCLVSFLVDGKGVPVKKSIKIPDYLKSIALTTIEDEEKAKMFDIKIEDIFATWIVGMNKNNRRVNNSDLKDLLNKIIVELNWTLLANALEDNQFKCLAYSESLNLNKVQNTKNIKFDTNEITSSLIVDDLKFVKKYLESNITSAPLEQYLSENFNEDNRIDVVKDKTFFRDSLDIANLPMASWTFKGGYPLVSSQQMAVNQIFKEINNTSILSINGAPGTGKTTLLKDVVANIIYLRAVELFKFKNKPNAAFSKLGEVSWKLNNRSKQDIFKLNNNITGFEMVVASSNNGAVENITKELPLKNEIDENYAKDLNYLSELATNINDDDSWGMISATLGNKLNNYNFFSKFLYANSNDDNSEVTRSIFDYLNHPNYFSEKRLSWEDACLEFEKSQQKVKILKGIAEEKKYNTLRYKKEYDKAIMMKKEYEHSVLLHNKSIKSFNVKAKHLIQLKSVIELKKKEIQKLKKSKDSLFSMKKISLNPYILEYNKLLEKRSILKLELSDLRISVNSLALDRKNNQNAFYKAKNTLSKLKEYNEKYLKKTNQEVPLDSFWEQSYEKIQKSSPWISKELNDARKELFCASLNLQKSFILENNEYIASNLQAFKQVLSGNFYEDEDYLLAIWQTIFLIVPVLSTTFSSFGTLFNRLPANSIGWLLIDEAGQATPQSPIGALWRSKKAIVVGDPLQVEPVVLIEDKLSDVLLEKNNVDKIWNSTKLSAQEIADRTNPYGTIIDIGIKKWVGMPLRVHRRCDEPMFSISNKIAYNDLMIYGKKRAREKSDVEKVIGKTAWFNVVGEPDNDSHWIPSEGDKVMELLKEICFSEFYKDKGVLPPLYIITPFKNVSFELINLLMKNKQVWCPDNITNKDIENWLNSSIGTIHSFQGDETDIVFLVLGGNIARPSAISWVCEAPNILNVATTRARKAFYIIGNKSIWNKGVFGLIRSFIK